MYMGHTYIYVCMCVCVYIYIYIYMLLGWRCSSVVEHLPRKALVSTHLSLSFLHVQERLGKKQV